MVHERLVEIPWLLRNIRGGSILDIGSVKDPGTDYISELAKEERDIVLVDTRRDDTKGNRIKTIRADIRKLIVQEIGKFNNILLISTLEHIGLTAYDNEANWKDSPASEQLRTFRHCMNFLKDSGIMLFTVPYGKYEHGGWFLVYDKNMIEEVKRGYKVINETYFTLKKQPEEKYIECGEGDCPLLGIDSVPNQGMRATSVVCLALTK